jgi:hypothetical protein
MHGGLSMELEKVDQIHDIKRPSEVPDSGNIIYNKIKKNLH